MYYPYHVRIRKPKFIVIISTQMIIYFENIKVNSFGNEFCYFVILIDLFVSLI